MATTTTSKEFPDFCFGAGVFSGAYNPLPEANAYAAVERALSEVYSVCMFDTAPYYGQSEIILGEALRRVADRFPRDRYMISTKIGRYGLKRADFDYSASRVKESVAESCRRLGVNKLDIVFCHDSAINQKCYIGYPLDTLLRIAKKQAERGPPLDIILSYCHYTLQNTLLEQYIPQFRTAGVAKVMNASPLCMGLFRDMIHPTSSELRQATRHCAACVVIRLSIANLALRFSMQFTQADTIMVGCSTPDELDCALDHFIAIRNSSQYVRNTDTSNYKTILSQTDKYLSCLHKVQLLLAPYHNVSWESPPSDA
ncbi:NADP-dependent oxidoreductase domain-containing protein [Syncephalis plumigaleata]|nr:NADP-dependent oxidoreductase domain-containing protein [Syncephalis plumigaleata]